MTSPTGVMLIGALASLSAPLGSQESVVRQEVLRTFSALNAGDAEQFLSYLTPRTQVFFFGGSALIELGLEDWRMAFAAGHRFHLVPRQIRVQLQGNTAVIAAYVHGTLRLASGAVVGGPWRYSETRVHARGTWKILQQHFSALGQDVGQVADRRFRPAIDDPAYPLRSGPLVLIDEAHFNLHTAWGSYRPLAELLRQDGYVVRESGTPFTAEALEPAAVLVIANAMSQNVIDDIQAPPSAAFTGEEVAAVRDWVVQGGALLLLVDHNPYPATAAQLTQAFGLRYLDCGASYEGVTSGRLVFRRAGRAAGGPPVATGIDSIRYASGGSLTEHSITAGIDSVATFLGSAFQVDVPHQPLLVFGPGVECFSAGDHVASVSGFLQGAVLEFGRGRVAAFGEAGMFTAQMNVWAGTRMGMNNPLAAQNPQLLRNVMHWLTRLGDRP